MTHQPPQHIVIAGGGVAAIEAVAALRALAGQLPRITVLAPESELTPRPASVAAPFGFGLPTALPFDAIRRHARFDLHRVTLERVEADTTQEDGSFVLGYCKSCDWTGPARRARDKARKDALAHADDCPSKGKVRLGVSEEDLR